MNPQDDPEARIRAMEQSLVDAAHNSQLDYSKPSGYSSLPAAPRRNRFAGQWLSLVVLAGCVIGLVASTVIFVGLIGSDTSREPSRAERPGGSERRSPAPDDAQLAEVGKTVSVSGSGKLKTIVCANGSVSVSGTENVVEITGFCAKVTVSGFDNKVTLDAAEVITASGSRNVVTYHTGAPKINKSGFDNAVEQG